MWLVQEGWVLIRVNFDPMQDVEPKVGVGTLLRVGALS